jgi:hypothetical protein
LTAKCLTKVLCVWNTDIQNEKGNGDGEDAIAESFQAIGIMLV